MPERASVSLFEIRGATTMFGRSFERGVGLTDSCGSAMAASVFAACLSGQTDFGRELIVLNRGGLVRGQAEADGMVRLSGNATWDWTGSAERGAPRSEEHTSEIQSLMRHAHAVFCLKKTKQRIQHQISHTYK